MIQPDSFTENACGIVMLTRAMFASVSKVRSKNALLVVLPGARNDDLPGLGLAESSFAVHWMFLRDPLHRNWSRRLVTIVQMGAVTVVPHKLDDAPVWDTSSHMEFSILMNRRLLTSDDSWNSFLASSRTQVVAMIRGLHSSFTPASVEFYAWVKLDSHSHKVTFRAPSAQRDLLLSASGVQVPFIINVVCRDDSARSRRDLSSSVVWLGKLNFSDSLALVKQVDSHLGLVLSKQSFGIRCATSSLELVRRLVFPQGANFADINIGIRGCSRFIVSGLPPGVSRSEIIKRFGEWKHGSTSGWAIIPVKQWNTSGQSHCLVKADSDPPSHCYLCKDCRVLIQPDVSEPFVPKARSSSAPRAKSKSRAQPNASSVPVAPSPALISRVLAVENRLDLLEARSTSIESQLQSGFAQILARLDDRSSSARRPAVDHTGATPPPKVPRASVPPGLADQSAALPNSSS